MIPSLESKGILVEKTSQGEEGEKRDMSELMGKIEDVQRETRIETRIQTRIEGREESHKKFIVHLSPFFSLTLR